LQKKNEEEAKEALRKKAEFDRALKNAIERALKQHRVRLCGEYSALSQVEVIDYMELMRFTPMALELLYSTSGSTSLTPADVVNAIKMVPKLQDHLKKRSAEEEAEGRTDAKKKR
jgi:hypothetical protein